MIFSKEEVACLDIHYHSFNVIDNTRFFFSFQDFSVGFDAHTDWDVTRDEMD